MIRLYVLPCCVALILAGSPASAHEEPRDYAQAQTAALRTWKDGQGRTFQGTYVSATETHVTIRRADGKTFDVERARLSNDDQAYVKSTLELGAATKSTTPPPAPSTNSSPTGPGTGTDRGNPFQKGDFRHHMLIGYDPSSPNFTQPWPKDAGINTEPEIKVVEENTDAKRFIYESPHFSFTSNVVLRPSLLAKVAMMFEACYQTHRDVPFNNRRTRSPQAPKLKARLFETMEQYHAAGGPKGSAGVYKGGPDEFLVPLESLGVKKVGSGYMFDYKGNFHTMYHEITHQLWADIHEMAGMWMVEGFAEFMASPPYSNGRFSFVKLPRAAMEYVTEYGKDGNGGRALGENIVMPKLSDLMTMDQPKFYANGNANYGYGMLLTYYFILVDGEGDGARFKKCIQASQEGKSEEEARKVLLDGRSYEQLEKEFADGMRRKGVKISFR